MIRGPLRAILRWAGRDPRAAARLSAQPAFARAALRFVPGPDIGDALGAAVDLQVLGIGTVYTRLVAPPTDAAGARAVADGYLDLLVRIAEAEITGELSLRLADLGVDLDEDSCLVHLRAIAGAAGGQGSFLWIDTEDAPDLDRTLDVYQRLRVTHPNTGVFLQASLRRTARDVERLLPMGPAVRLVKGLGGAPRSVAFTSRKEIDANYLSLAVTLLRESRARAGMRVALGTHDVTMVEQVALHAAAAGIPRDAFEVQMLYGVRAREVRRLARTGYRVQTLIPYGDAWYGWFMRRLAERPANLLGVLRQTLP